MTTDLDHADLEPVPWRNGAGTTREVARQDAPGTAVGFDWRVSIADLTASGEFSSFPGVERTFVALGDGVELTIDDRVSPVARLDRVRFAGEAGVTLQLSDGPAMAVNLMTRRGFAGADAVSIDVQTGRILVLVDGLVVVRCSLPS